MTKAKVKLPYRWPGLRNSAPRMTTCSACRASVMVGYHRGWPIPFDTYPLSPYGEAEALIMGHMTYHSVGTFLYRRTVADINTTPAPQYGTIYRTHVCHAAPPTYLQPPVEDSDVCPF